MARRRKTRISKWVVGIFLVVLTLGASTEHWQEILAGASGIMVMLFAWVAFRNVVYCDVNKSSKPGYCTRKVRGSLFGCDDHHWHKLIAWSRYLGTGYMAGKMHITLPILRWQAGELLLDRVAPRAQGRSMGDIDAKEVYNPAPFVQALVIYITLLSGLATIAGFGLSIAQAAAMK
jgi:hypothetical protein